MAVLLINSNRQQETNLSNCLLDFEGNKSLKKNFFFLSLSFSKYMEKFFFSRIVIPIARRRRRRLVGNEECVTDEKKEIHLFFEALT